MLNANNVHDGNTESNCNANCELGRRRSIIILAQDEETVTAIVPQWFVSCAEPQEVLYDNNKRAILRLDDNLAPCVLLFDSLKAHQANIIMRNLRKYLSWSISEEISMKLKGSSSNSGAKPGDSSGKEEKKKKKKKDVPNSFNEKEIKLTAKDLPVFHVPALPRKTITVIVACLFSSMS